MRRRDSGGKAVSAEDLRASLWFWPALSALVALIVTLVLLNVRPVDGGSLRWLWPGDAASASGLLQTIATSIMTATTLTFSLTVVALQLASQQFSPRLLREFARNRFTQVVLAVLVSTFVVALTGMRGMSGSERMPVLVIGLAFALAIVSAGALVAFLGHIVRALRVDTMMVAVHQETAATIAETYRPHGDRRDVPRSDLPGPVGGTLLLSERSGFVRVIRADALVEAASRAGAFVRFAIRPGDHIVEGTPIATAWEEDSRPGSLEELQSLLNRCVELGFERTIEQDAALGMRQLTDIAVKAISPAINDPVTAAHAVGYCADLLIRLQGRHLGERQHDDQAGVPRVVLPDRDHRYYLDLVCGPIRRFGREEPLVLCALLAMLRDCVTGARDESQRTAILRQVELILDEVSERLLQDDIDRILDVAGRVRLAADGDIAGAYLDRAGETRST